MDIAWKTMTEKNIIEYIQSVDFKHPDFDLKEVKKALKQIIGSEPSVKLKWNTSEKINELLRDSGAKDYKEVIEKIEHVEIIYLDSDNRPIPIKLIM